MAQSLATVQVASPIEKREQTEFSPTKGLSDFVEHQADQVIYHEVRKDADGQVIDDHGVPVQYAVGSGTRGRTDLINNSGRLCASMISWYVDGNAWGLSPGSP